MYMGYFIVDEEKLKEKINQWNDKNYREKVMWDITCAKADVSHMLEALQEAEKDIDNQIKKLEEKKNDLRLLIEYAK